MKYSKRITSVLLGIGSVVWTLAAILAMITGTFEKSPVLFILELLCAPLCAAVFVLSLKSSRKNDL